MIYTTNLAFLYAFPYFLGDICAKNDFPYSDEYRLQCYKDYQWLINCP